MTEQTAIAEPTTAADTCVRCQHAKEHGWWGPGTRSHCADCHRDWNGGTEAHCAVCCTHFASDRSFDAHLTEEGCRAPESMVRQDGRPKFVALPAENGKVTWRAPRYDNRPRPWGN